MDPLLFIVAFIAGAGAALAGGALCGLKIGAEALGAELAAYMGGFYGLLAGSIGVVLGLIVLTIL